MYKSTFLHAHIILDKYGPNKKLYNTFAIVFYQIIFLVIVEHVCLYKVILH